MFFCKGNIGFAHFGIGGKAARGKDDTVGGSDFGRDTFQVGLHANYPFAFGQQFFDRAILKQIHSCFDNRMKQPSSKRRTHCQPQSAAQFFLVPSKADSNFRHMPKRAGCRQPGDIWQVKQIDHHPARRVEFLARPG